MISDMVMTWKNLTEKDMDDSTNYIWNDHFAFNETK